MNTLALPVKRQHKNPKKSTETIPSRPSACSFKQDYSCFILLKYAASLLLISSLSFAVQAAGPDINKNWRSIAIKGYDPVAYFTLGKAVEGKSRFEFRWHDARWRFVSEEHLEMFAENPEHYAPRFGGYCAEGMAFGRKASIDPEAWLIVDGELYLNYSVEVRDEMALDPRDTIGKADLIWEKLGSIVGKP